MRASDAERERAVEQLRVHAAAGRLTVDELDERVVIDIEPDGRGGTRIVAWGKAPRGVRRAFAQLLT